MRAFHHTLAALVFLSASSIVTAAEVNLNGVIGEKALLIVDGGRPHWVSPGASTPEGIKLVSIHGQSAVIESDGKRQTLTLGDSVKISGGGGSSSSIPSVTLNADIQGHFITGGTINGVGVRFLVDTGASMISMSTSDAKRLGIDYAAGQRASVSTANGVVPAYKIKLDQVKVGDVLLNNVDGVVQMSEGLPVILLGMSFLNRLDMHRDGERMTLTKRF